MIPNIAPSVPSFVGAACLALVVCGRVAADPDDGRILAEMHLREASAPVREMQGWHPPKKIVIVIDSAARLAWLQASNPASATVLVAATNYRELKEKIVDADALVGPCVAEVIGAGTRLNWVQTGEVGVENCVSIPSIRAGKVILTNMRGVSSVTVAEHAMSLILALSRQLPVFIDTRRDNQSTPRGAPIALAGKTLLVVGLGSNGREIAERAQAFHMHVIATNKESMARPDFVDYLGQADELRQLLGKADFVVNATPLTKDTLAMFDRDMFARMRPTAFFFNLGRGRSVVTDDLVSALQAGVIAGAGLDVVDPDPLPYSHPLRKMSNVIITPHMADNSELKSERSWILIRENLRRYISGAKLLSVVDAKKGY